MSGGGLLRSKQWGYGYVIEPGDMTLDVADGGLMGGGTEPLDWVEEGPADTPIYPPSLYEDQLRRRLGHEP